MYLAWDFPGIAAPVITGDKTKLKRGKQAQQFTACLIVAQADGVGNHSFSFGIKGIPKPMTIRMFRIFPTSWWLWSYTFLRIDCSTILACKFSGEAYEK